MTGPLRVRRLGTVAYETACELQSALHARAGEAWLLLLEHPHVYTLGVRGKPEHLLVDPTSVGARVVSAHRGGDVTYHGPGQLVGYPIVDVALGPDAIPAHVRAVEQVVIDALGDLGVEGATRRAGFPGVWIDDRKIAAVGVRVTRGRSMHGVALNVRPDLTMFDHIVPCGISGCAITSLAAEGAPVDVDTAADALACHAARRWGAGAADDRPATAEALADEVGACP